MAKKEKAIYHRFEKRLEEGLKYIEQSGLATARPLCRTEA